MELLNVKSDVVLQKMPYLRKTIKDTFGDKKVTFYSYMADDKLGFIIMSIGKGLLINSNGENIKFKNSMTGHLRQIEKNDYIIRPRIEYDLGDDYSTKSDVSLIDMNGNESSLMILPSYNDENYKNRVCFVQSNKDNSMTCEINYDYMADDNIIYPGLLNRIESVHLIKDLNSKGFPTRVGLLSKRLMVYSRRELDCDTLNYSFVSFNEHGILKTLMNGSYNLYKTNYIVRYCKMGMSLDKTLVELPWPISSYKKEEDIIKLVSDYGFMVTIPKELIDVYNNQDQDIVLLQEFLDKRDKQKKLKR